MKLYRRSQSEEIAEQQPWGSTSTRKEVALYQVPLLTERLPSSWEEHCGQQSQNAAEQQLDLQLF